MKVPTSKYPEAFYRVSVKVIIRQGANILAVKEHVDAWTLPGGGLDHGESLEQAIRRELYEEANITQPIASLRLLGTGKYYRSHEQDWILWLVAEVTFDEPLVYSIGADATAVAYIDPSTLKNSPHRPERLIYKWCVDPMYEIEEVK